MHRFRSLRAPCVTACLLAASAAAGRTQTAPTPTSAAPTTRSVWFDVGALTIDQIRAGVEAIPLSRFTAGLSVAYSHTPHPRDVPVPPYAYLADPGTGVRPVSCDPRMLTLCVDPAYYYGDPPRYRAWAFNLAVRYYPEPLSFRNGAARMMVYAGGYVGYHWRTWDENPVYYYGRPVPLAATPELQQPALSPTDSVIPLPPPGGYYPVACCLNPIRHTLKGVEPGVELGVRLLPIGPLFIEAGGRFTLAVIDDPMQRVRPGDVETRLVVAGGIAW
jgi:hypothetical protein